MADLPNNPNNREEEYLADIAGLPNDVPENPWSRKEAYLAAIGGRLDGIDEKIAALATDISLKGSVADYDHLPTDAAVGDAYITEDTGILYVWVGDEWTPLNMQGGGGIKKLTTADYNYPENNPTSVALWRLEPGVYVVDDTTNYSINARYSRNYPTTLWNKNFVIVGGTAAQSFIMYQSIQSIYIAASSNDGSSSMFNSEMLAKKDVRNNLTSTDTTIPLSANQGKVLNDKFGGMRLVQLTQAEYDALATKDANTLYIIKAA